MGPGMSTQEPTGRIQTTVSIEAGTLSDLEDIARMAGLSKSVLFDLGMRRFLRWASTVTPDAIRAVAEWEITEVSVPYKRGQAAQRRDSSSLPVPTKRGPSGPPSTHLPRTPSGLRAAVAAREALEGVSVRVQEDDGPSSPSDQRHGRR
jgi:hypothetical protein